MKQKKILRIEVSVSGFSLRFQCAFARNSSSQLTVLEREEVGAKGTAGRGNRYVRKK